MEFHWLKLEPSINYFEPKCSQNWLSSCGGFIMLPTAGTDGMGESLSDCTHVFVKALLLIIPEITTG